MAEDGPDSGLKLCSQCATPRAPGARFCAGCGISFDLNEPPIAVPGAPKPSLANSPNLPAWAKPAGIAIGIVVILSILANNRDTTPPFGDDGSALGSDHSCTREITYEVEGTAHGTDITMTDSSGSISQQSGLAVPLQSKDGGQGLTSIMSCGDFASISAQNTGSHGTITCRISADGVVLDETTSSGAYVIASCDAIVE